MREKFSICLFTSQMVETTRVGQVQGQEPGTLYGSPMWILGSSDLNQALLGSWIRNEAARTPTSANMGFQCCRQLFNLMQNTINPILVSLINKEEQQK